MEYAKNIKSMFLHREFTSNTGKIFKFKRCSKVVGDVFVIF